METKYSYYDSYHVYDSSGKIIGKYSLDDYDVEVINKNGYNTLPLLENSKEHSSIKLSYYKYDNDTIFIPFIFDKKSYIFVVNEYILSKLLLLDNNKVVISIENLNKYNILSKVIIGLPSNVHRVNKLSYDKGTYSISNSLKGLAFLTRSSMGVEFIYNNVKYFLNSGKIHEINNYSFNEYNLEYNFLSFLYQYDNSLFSDLSESNIKYNSNDYIWHIGRIQSSLYDIIYNDENKNIQLYIDSEIIDSFNESTDEVFKNVVFNLYKKSTYPLNKKSDCFKEISEISDLNIRDVYKMTDSNHIMIIFEDDDGNESIKLDKHYKENDDYKEDYNIKDLYGFGYNSVITTYSKKGLIKYINDYNIKSFDGVTFSMNTPIMVFKYKNKLYPIVDLDYLKDYEYDMVPLLTQDFSEDLSCVYFKDFLKLNGVYTDELYYEIVSRLTNEQQIENRNIYELFFSDLKFNNNQYHLLSINSNVRLGKDVSNYIKMYNDRLTNLRIVESSSDNIRIENIGIKEIEYHTFNGITIYLKDNIFGLKKIEENMVNLEHNNKFYTVI